MGINYTTEFDDKLNETSIYKNYSVLLPFIGNQYQNSYKKVLFIGESHYLPKKYNNKIGYEWYDKNLDSYDFDETSLSYINTRKIIDNDVINNPSKNNSHSIYRNFANVYGEVFGTGDYNTSLKYISFYNFFLRPAETLGKSIKSDWYKDHTKSFENLIYLNKILKPDKIIFVSKLARKGFDSVFYSEEYQQKYPEKFIDFKLNKVESVTHPGSAWWNRITKSYGGITGKQKLENILLKLKRVN